ncbi:MAG TPA: hypothetical protein VF624_14520 [Tepidisphaeraceae bacterium]
MSFRIKDNMHLRDMLEVGLVDSTWTAHLPADLAARLQSLIDTPEGRDGSQFCRVRFTAPCLAIGRHGATNHILQIEQIRLIQPEEPAR